MTEQATFSLRNRNPDVLTCIANLSNDEVFTPPDVANRMLDQVAEAWSAGHDGANLWSDSSVRFLDPFTKSGVFLREVTTRLTEGLADEIPDLRQRVDHVLANQVYGIAITHLTSLVARRSLYCSKWANGKHSIASGFADEFGNVWFEELEHRWLNDRCKFCGARERDYERGPGRETHAYALIHTNDPQQRVADIFGEEMRFDVVIGNPPYQLGQSGGESVGSFAMPIYQKFVEAARSLDPRYISMIIPSRWFAGGRGLDEFRETMLADTRLRSLTDFPDSRDVFPGVDVAGGVSYFLWDSEWTGKCEITTVRKGEQGPVVARDLDQFDILVRYNEAIPILERVLGGTESVNSFKSMADEVAPIQPFSLRTNFRGATGPEGLSEPVLLYQNGGTGYIERQDVPRNQDWIDDWKVFLSSTASEHGGQSDKSGSRRVFSRIILGPPGTACTETYLVAGRFATEAEAQNFAAYLRTRFVRYLVSLRTNTQHLFSQRFAFVPKLPMNRAWTDDDLAETFALSDSDRTTIRDVIKPMEPEE